MSQELAGLRRLLMERLKAEGSVRVYDPIRKTPTDVSFKQKREVRPPFCPPENLLVQLEEDHGAFGEAVLAILVREQVDGHVEEYWCEIASPDALQDAVLLRMLSTVPDG